MVTRFSRGILGPFFHMKMSMPSQHLCRCILGDAGHTRHLLHKGRHSNQELSAFHVPVSPKSFLCTQTLSSQYTDARAAYQELSLKAKAGLPPPPVFCTDKASYRSRNCQEPQLQCLHITWFELHVSPSGILTEPYRLFWNLPSPSTNDSEDFIKWLYHMCVELLGGGSFLFFLYSLNFMTTCKPLNLSQLRSPNP